MTHAEYLASSRIEQVRWLDSQAWRHPVCVVQWDRYQILRWGKERRPREYIHTRMAVHGRRRGKGEQEGPQHIHRDITNHSNQKCQ